MITFPFYSLLFLLIPFINTLGFTSLFNVICKMETSFYSDACLSFFVLGKGNHVLITSHIVIFFPFALQEGNCGKVCPCEAARTVCSPTFPICHNSVSCVCVFEKCALLSQQLRQGFHVTVVLTGC